MDKQEIPKEHKKVFQAHVNSMAKYHPGIYDGKVTLFRVSTMSLLRSFDPEFGWERLAKDGVENDLIPGSHSNLLDDLYVEELARLLEACIDRANSQRSEASKNVESFPKTCSQLDVNGSILVTGFWELQPVKWRCPYLARLA